MSTELLAWVLLAALAAAPVAAEVYRWKDSAGQVHYGDRPAAGAEPLAGLEKNAPVYAMVSNVHDGDTVALDDGTKVRLLGINTPEIDSATSSAESGGETAKLWLKARIEGRKARLEGDAEANDHYGRRLAHLFAEDGEHLNLSLVQQGLAVVSIFPPNLKYAEQLSQAQQQAKQAGRGVWGDPAYTAKPIASLPQTPSRGWQRWQGRAESWDYSHNYLRLHFGAVEVNIPKENLGLFPPVREWAGKSLEIRGWASRRKGRYSILIRHPSALEVLQ